MERIRGILKIHVPVGATRFATALTAVARAQIPKLREHHRG
ncbi:hypothetical protein [Flavobacterium soli]|nr:hypothetical protein [Flavobacterium soli]